MLSAISIEYLTYWRTSPESFLPRNRLVVGVLVTSTRVSGNSRTDHSGKQGQKNYESFRITVETMGEKPGSL
jgi:hypothetical protein